MGEDDIVPVGNEAGVRPEAFSPQVLADELWQKMNQPGFHTDEIDEVGEMFSAEQRDNLSANQIGKLGDAIIDRSREKAGAIMDFFESFQELNDVSEEMKEEMLRRCIALRFFMYAAADLQQYKSEKLAGKVSVAIEDLNDFATDLLFSSFHDVTGFVNEAAALLGTSDWEPEESKMIQGRLIDKLRGLIDYLGERGGLLDLVDRSAPVIGRGIGNELSMVVATLQGKYAGKGIRVEVDHDKLRLKKIKGGGVLLYSVLKNMANNALEAQLERGKTDGAQMEIGLINDGGSVRIECANDGYFPDQWLDREGNIIVTGKTTKEGGSGRGLKIITDYAKSAGGKLKVENREGQVRTILEVPLGEEEK